jgi:hypothetical protein
MNVHDVRLSERLANLQNAPKTLPTDVASLCTRILCRCSGIRTYFRTKLKHRTDTHRRRSICVDRTIPTIGEAAQTVEVPQMPATFRLVVERRLYV